MSRASAFTPQHAQQMQSLREWARKQGQTPPAIPNQERRSLDRTLAQVADTAPADPNPSMRTDGEPAPDPPPAEGAD